MALFTSNILNLEEETNSRNNERNQSELEENVSLVHYDQMTEISKTKPIREDFSFLKVMSFIGCIIIILIIILSRLTIIIDQFLIIFSKGYQSFKFIFTLNNILISFKINFGTLPQFAFFFVVLIFKIITLVESIKNKGVSLLWKRFYIINEKLQNHEKISSIWVMLYASIVMMYDFIILIPVISEFNNIPFKCSLISSLSNSDCGMSFFGLLLLYSTRNLKIFSFFELFASIIFVISSSIWVYELILKKLIQKVYDSQKKYRIFRNNFKLSKI